MAEVEGQGRAPPVVDPTAFITKLKYVFRHAPDMYKLVSFPDPQPCTYIASSLMHGGEISGTGYGESLVCIFRVQ